MPPLLELIAHTNLLTAVPAVCLPLPVSRNATSFADPRLRARLLVAALLVARSQPVGRLCVRRFDCRSLLNADAARSAADMSDRIKNEGALVLLKRKRRQNLSQSTSGASLFSSLSPRRLVVIDGAVSRKGSPTQERRNKAAAQSTSVRLLLVAVVFDLAHDGRCSQRRARRRSTRAAAACRRCRSSTTPASLSSTRRSFSSTTRRTPQGAASPFVAPFVLLTARTQRRRSRAGNVGDAHRRRAQGVQV